MSRRGDHARRSSTGIAGPPRGDSRSEPRALAACSERRESPRGGRPDPGVTIPYGGTGTRGPLLRRFVASLVLLLAVSGCDNIVKYIPVFATMTDTESIETYEEQPVPPPEGAVPVTGDDPDFPLQVADTTSELQNPLAGTEAQLARGDSLYGAFCLPCHGPEGKGKGPVVNHDQQHPRRLPYIPTVNLVTETGPTRSDGYIWGMIENGRGLMPAYRRIPEEDRWYIVEYVRKLQRDAGADPERGVAGPDRTATSE